MNTTLRHAAAVLLLAAIAPGACAPRARPAEPAEARTAAAPGVGDLARLMTGHFTSAEQSLADNSYFEIHLRMARIWEDRADGPWLYIEQAMSDAMDKPYRQRVYNLSRLGADKYQSAVYELPGGPEDALKFAGAWRDPAMAFAALSPADLRPRDGCEVVLKWDAPSRSFKGGTLAANCPSTLRGAAYATSEIVLSDGLLVSWDRGFDATGKQVWGAVKGGYRFVRIAP